MKILRRRKPNKKTTYMWKENTSDENTETETHNVKDI